MSILSNPDMRHLAKSQIVHMLDAICKSIEPTDSQYNDARERYETIGSFLAEEGSPLRRFQPTVYPQGSIRIRAAIRPTKGKEFDVDLVCEFKFMPHDDPKVVKQLVWDRFRNSERYRSMAVEKNRCVQIQYAGDFHMDVMPCVPGKTNCARTGSVWVPDKKLDDWKPSNPKGFAQFVESAAAKQPVQKMAFSNTVMAESADVQPLPSEQSFTKAPLIRIIQILKRHRDEFFRNNHEKSPISVIITTLATHSYNQVVGSQVFDSVYDLLIEVVNAMARHVVVKPTTEYWIANPSHAEENFAEKWNHDPSLPKWFFKWHRTVATEIRALAEQEVDGLDRFGKVLEHSFGVLAANEAIKAMSSFVKRTTASGNTRITSSGLVISGAAAIRTVSSAPPHNFHGS